MPTTSLLWSLTIIMNGSSRQLTASPQLLTHSHVMNIDFEFDRKKSFLQSFSRRMNSRQSVTRTTCSSGVDILVANSSWSYLKDTVFDISIADKLPWKLRTLPERERNPMIFSSRLSDEISYDISVVRVPQMRSSHSVT